MLLHELKPARGSTKGRMRKGRGNGSKGAFSGRGCKGQNARKSGGVRPGFEGGQTPLYRRMPKLGGFQNPNRINFFPVNLSLLTKNFSSGDTITIVELVQKGIIKKNTPVKILGEGKIDLKLNIKVERISASAKKAIEKAGGTVEETLPRQTKEPVVK